MYRVVSWLFNRMITTVTRGLRHKHLQSHVMGRTRSTVEIVGENGGCKGEKRLGCREMGVSTRSLGE